MLQIRRMKFHAQGVLTALEQASQAASVAFKSILTGIRFIHMMDVQVSLSVV